MISKNHALVVLSGGQDSTTCLYWAMTRFDKVHAVTFDYGQRHAAELDAARRVWALATARYPDKRGEHTVLSVGPILRSTSPLVSDATLDQYADPASLPGGLEKTFVPMRNQLFLTLAANIAVDLRCSNIVTGVCQEDFGGYPDCRQDFIDCLAIAVNESLGVGTDTWPDTDGIEILTPLMNLTKAESVHLAVKVGAYLPLAFSHTAYDGQYPPTGRDHASLLRAKGFAEAGMPDPLVMRAIMEGAMPPPPEYPELYSDMPEASINGKLIRRLAESLPLSLRPARRT